ncbi:aspartic peptidase domain-containing protein [Fimicolochytrium jonesii]|uniref:aspartic peptidase domain-containing protein n=1 Tax=Fimicolochytrium jonesii TaxID=1396493 RepID=UPI0022FDEBA6|nr:aspartic peptidase domain-containing protein [Fimicolochytrium jonesii]KAI8816701.1 aspartic peptidase domain-containing protein [Fimicolochytrium jonesii]
MKLLTTVLIFAGIYAASQDAAALDPASEPGPAIIPMIRHAEGRHATRRSLLTRSEEGLVVVRPNVTEAQLDDALSSVHFVNTEHEEVEKLLADGKDNLFARGVYAPGADPDYIGDGDEDEKLKYFVGEEDDDEPPLRRRAMGGGKHGGLKRRAGTVAAATVRNNYDTMYYVTLFLGNPPQPFSVVIDTGSADLWVPGLQCTTQCGSKRRYNPTASKTAAQQGLAVSTWYGTGSVSGTVVVDDVRIGNLSAKYQVFIQANTASNVQPGSIDGLMGMSFSPLSWANSVVDDWLVGKSSLVENLYWSQKIPQPAFGIWLDRYSSWSATPDTMVGGELTLGSNLGNPARYTGPITWLSVPDASTWWHVSWLGISGPNNVNVRPPGRNIRGLVDTGATLVLTDYAVAVQLNAQIPSTYVVAKGLWACNCGTVANSGVTFTFNLNGFPFTLSGSELVTRVWPNNADLCYSPFQSRKNQDVLDQWLLGEVFLRKYYQIYDYNPAGAWKPRVGLALAT